MSGVTQNLSTETSGVRWGPRSQVCKLGPTIQTFKRRGLVVWRCSSPWELPRRNQWFLGTLLSSGDRVVIRELASAAWSLCFPVSPWISSACVPALIPSATSPSQSWAEAGITPSDLQNCELYKPFPCVLPSVRYFLRATGNELTQAPSHIL